MNAEQKRRLISAAMEAGQHAYVPHSNFRVGAALLTADGSIVQGCNVENDSYGLTICAERVAVTSAVAQGRRDFRALAIATRGRVTPCGACRQVLTQFCDDLRILLVDPDSADEVVEVQLSDLLPQSFGLPRDRPAHLS